MKFNVEAQIKASEGLVHKGAVVKAPNKKQAASIFLAKLEEEFSDFEVDMIYVERAKGAK